MNKYLKKLYAIGEAEKRMIIGLMSGTSLDGLDIALCEITGYGLHTSVKLVAFETIVYNPYFKEQVRGIFSKKTVDLEMVCLMNAWIGEQHGKMILGCLDKWNIPATSIDLVASHGQSIYHAPQLLHQKPGFGNATLQIGDGDHIAVTTGIITVSDFRQKHVAAGGEGAPLAVYGDHFIFSKRGEDRIMLNIGGIANFTYLPGDMDATSIFSTDTGPGNTMMDAYCQHKLQIPYDKDSAIARTGTPHEGLLKELQRDLFFEKGFPKTTGPELFNLTYLDHAIQVAGASHLSDGDVMATLNLFSAITITEAVQRSLKGRAGFSIYTSGGGMHNPLLMEHIQTRLPGNTFYTTDALAINPDAKEAILFAILANETVAGGDTHIGNGKQDIPAVSMGKISFPG